MEHRVILRDDFPIANTERLVIIAGPCQIESRDMCLMVADKMQRWCDSLGLGYVFKASFDKANRTARSSPRGLGMDEGLRILQDVARDGHLVTTDIHDASQAWPVGDVVDIIQIPALLARQTDILAAAGRTGKVVNIKKGQGMAPEDMVHAAIKVGEGQQNRARVLLTERGTSFGHHDLVVDMRGLLIMKEETGWPIIIDASHSVQKPASKGFMSGGDRSMIEPIARAAVASTPIAGVFVECHPDPDRALSDGATSLPLEHMPAFMARVQQVDAAVKYLS